jgi:predicted PurR-regulated permease PerM
MSTPPPLSDILTAVLNAIQTIMYEVASAIASNASVIATALVLGGLVFVMFRYGTRIFRGLTGWFRGLF